MYYIVTGAAGFVGSNIVKALNRRGETDVIAVDNLAKADKFVNLADCDIADYFAKEAFLGALAEGLFDGAVHAVLHQGACSDTLEQNGHYMMENNYRYSAALLNYCQNDEVPLIYASSASVYGRGTVFSESREFEAPLNIYGYSKFLFDQFVRRKLGDSAAQIVGLRYFNVYGEREQHKGRMASVAYQLFKQYRESGKVKLFEGSGGYGPGEQRRDFVSVEDITRVNLFFLDHPDKSGIFNVGTGAAQTFNDVAVATVNESRAARGERALSLPQMREQKILEYIPFPGELKEQYQNFTQADLDALRKSGYAAPFLSVEEGVARYVQHLLKGRADLSTPASLLR